MEESLRSQSLPVRYRPHSFAEVIGQPAIISILSRQIETHSFKNTYLFCGPSGCGKTTCARIMASEINNREGEPIEIDAASNNGVDDIRQLIVDAQQTSVDSEYKTYIIDECLSGDVEILTDKGFIRFDSLSKTEKVAQYTDDGKIEFVTPYEWIEKDYCGDMYNIRLKNGVNVMMSPNHVQPLFYNKSKIVRENYIKDVEFAQSSKLIVSGYSNGFHTLSALDRLVIASQADGSLQYTRDGYSHWIMSLKRTRKIDRLLDLFNKSGVEFSEISIKRDGCRRFSYNLPENASKVLNTYFGFNVGSIEASEMLDEIVKWDGYSYKNYDGFEFSSIIKENVDYVSYLCAISGHTSQITEIRDDNVNHSTLYRIYWHTTTLKSCANIQKSIVNNYSGKIYCVKVPSHKIVVRKDGFVFITGNCHMLTNAAWNAALKLIEEPPSNAIFIFCTTNPNKIPETILSRVQRFDFKRISSKDIVDRLAFILNEEVVSTYTEDALYKIANKANGFMREAVSMLDKCLSYSSEINVDNVEKVLGLVKDDTLFNLLKSIIDKDSKSALNILNSLKSDESNLLFVMDSIVSFTLDCAKIQKTHTTCYGGISKSYEKYFIDLKEDLMFFVDRLFRYRQLCNGSNINSILDIVVLELCGR